jgi:hypothetical protein
MHWMLLLSQEGSDCPDILETECVNNDGETNFQISEQFKSINLGTPTYDEAGD